ncbi:hypothetical protein [Phenylobacterium sp.]|uniref:hypothetical protein n=1 Tax=Phenylobacterium sp. TaxID=1871053 RepID=UPI00301C7E33
MTRRAPVQIPPRLLTAEQAASYLGYATTGVLANIPVRPRRMALSGPGSQPKYDRAELDAWLDGLAGLSVPAASNDGAGQGAGRGPSGGADDADAAFAAWKAGKAGGAG